jgi:hypothetical protein
VDVSRDLHNLIKISLAISGKKGEGKSSKAQIGTTRSQTEIEFDIFHHQMTQKINPMK